VTATRLSEAAITTGYANRAREILGRVSTDLSTAAAQDRARRKISRVWGTVGRASKKEEEVRCEWRQG